MVKAFLLGIFKLFKFFEVKQNKYLKISNQCLKSKKGKM